MAVQFQNKNQRGVTLIELLVVVAIISVLTAMMIPRLRTINKDRNIRESARIVGSVFANASQRAVAEGTAGVIIERNPNLVDGENVNFGATTLYVMRKLPPYIGDVAASNTAGASVAGATVTIAPAPIEHSVSSPVIVPNDFISLNNSSVQYRIKSVSADGATIELHEDNFGPPIGTGYLPVPIDTGGDFVPFVIHRQPRKLESSRVELPEGYLIDMRYSGEINLNADASLADRPRTFFHEIEVSLTKTSLARHK